MITTCRANIEKKKNMFVKFVGTGLVQQKHRATHASPTLPCNECGQIFHDSACLERFKRNLNTDNKIALSNAWKVEKDFQLKYI
jgi:hypothetical protein